MEAYVVYKSNYYTPVENISVYREKEGVIGCEELGGVKVEEWLGGIYGSFLWKRMERDLKEEVAKKGGDTLLITGKNKYWTRLKAQELLGIAYRCEKK